MDVPSSAVQASQISETGLITFILHTLPVISISVAKLLNYSYPKLALSILDSFFFLSFHRFVFYFTFI